MQGYNQSRKRKEKKRKNRVKLSKIQAKNIVKMKLKVNK